MNQTTLVLASARFAAAVARLCLGPLLPLLTLSLDFPESAKPALLSAYSSGYILTQIAGGYLADRYGFAVIISISVGTSALILFCLTTFATTAVAWTQAFFCLGLVAGPLFPAGSAAISSTVKAEKRAASAAIVDASASAGTTVASLAPLIADRLGWRFVYQATAFGLVMVLFGTLSSLPSQPSSDVVIAKKKLSASYDLTNKPGRMSLSALFHPAALFTYLCHSADNFSKYSINSWAATMLVSKHGASPTLVGAILGTQEAVGVLSKLLIGMVFTASSPTFFKRGGASAIGFVIQALALWACFMAPTPLQAGTCMVVSALAAGSHSIGFRPIYFEASPDHAGSVSGFGNTIASFASVLGPVVVGFSMQQQQQQQGSSSGGSWAVVAFWMMMVNLGGALAGMCIALFVKKEGEKRNSPQSGSIKAPSEKL